VGQPLTFGAAMRINGDPTPHFDRAADESSKRGQAWLDMSWVDGDHCKPISAAMRRAMDAVDRFYYHSHSNADLLRNADAVSRAVSDVRRETRANRFD
jgi:hypothetical protein